MVRFWVEDERLVVGLNAWERFTAMDVVDPSVRLDEIQKVFWVPHIWRDVLHGGPGKNRSRKIDDPDGLSARTGAHLLFTANTRMHSKRGPAVVMTYGDGRGVVIDVRLGGSAWGLIAVSNRHPKVVVTEIRRAVRAVNPDFRG